METAGVVRVLIIDESPMMRVTLQRRLSADPQIDVVGVARDAYAARNMIRKLKPDVLTMDLNLHGMDGLTFLKKLMQHEPLPVIVLSDGADLSSARALEALRAGAVDVCGKPASFGHAPEPLAMLARQIKAAAAARTDLAGPGAAIEEGRRGQALRFAAGRIIAIGASTGGTRAIERILAAFPPNAPGTLIVQHMPAHFTRTFAEGLDRRCAMHVKEAAAGDDVRPGYALVAPGDRHMVLVRAARGYRVDLTRGPREHFQRPAVDVTFRSVSRVAGKEAVAVLLTGMGADGALGMMDVHRAGGQTLVQDQNTSVVFGMPKEAIRIGAAQQVLPLDAIAQEALRLSSACRGAA